MEKNWEQHAACRGTGDPEVFFAHPTEEARTASAKRICWNVCPVREECLESALKFESPVSAHGVRGGLDADQRRAKLRRESRKRSANRTLIVRKSSA